MSTNIRPEISNKKRYWLPRHRYYELKHFCLQYPSWKRALAELDGMNRSGIDTPEHNHSNTISSPVENCVEKRSYYISHIEMVERAAKESSCDLGDYVLRGVTEGLSYDCIKAKLEIPCCKDTYYDVYRRFFWILSNLRG